MTSVTTSAARPAVLLSPTESRTARALRRWSDDELGRFADAVVRALAADASRWGDGDAFNGHVDAPSTRGARRAVHAEDLEAPARLPDWSAVSEQGAWWSLGESPSRRISRALFGEPGTGPDALDGRRIADDLAGELWAGQLRALAALVAGDGLADAEALAQAWRRWSGAVLVELPWCGASLRLLFRAAQVERVVLAAGASGGRPARPAGASAVPVVPVLRALAGHGTRLDARLDSFEIDLGSLVSLNVGDVLRVRHPLDKPVRVCASQAPLDGEPVCAGWLGRRDAVLAIELVRPSQPTTATDPLRSKTLS